MHKAITIEGKVYSKPKWKYPPIEIFTSLTKSGKEFLETVDTNEFSVKPEHVGVVVEKKSCVCIGRDNWADIVLDKSTMRVRNW